MFMVNGTMLEQLFAGNFGMPMGQPCLTEAAWTMADLEKAVARLKANKVAEDAELIAGGPVTLVADGAVDWGGAGNAETNYVQHVAERKKKTKSTSNVCPIAVVTSLYTAWRREGGKFFTT